MQYRQWYPITEFLLSHQFDKRNIIVILLALLSDFLGKLVKLSQQNLELIVFSFHRKLRKPLKQLKCPITDSLAYCGGETLGQFIALVWQG